MTTGKVFYIITGINAQKKCFDVNGLSNAQIEIMSRGVNIRLIISFNALTLK